MKKLHRDKEKQLSALGVWLMHGDLGREQERTRTSDLPWALALLPGHRLGGRRDREAKLSEVAAS